MKLLLSKDKKFFLIQETSVEIMDALREHLHYVPAYYWVQKRRDPYKFYGWDGKKYMIDAHNRIPRGLWHEIYVFCKKNDIPLEIYGATHLREQKFNYKEFKEFAEKLFEDHPYYFPYDYQIKSAALILRNKYSQSEIATGAGKTLISYIIFMWLKHLGYQRQLIIVPRINLVDQLVEDFNEYANGAHHFTYQEIMGGTSKLKEDVDFVVGTYQSLSKLPKDWYSEVDSLFIDECLDGRTKISTLFGKTKIKRLKIGEIIETINDRTKEFEHKRIKRVFKNILSKNENMYKLTFENGKTIKISGNHEVRLNDFTYKMVKDLTLEDELLDIKSVKWS